MKLAIRGHATRGKEVIEIIEMLGGKNYQRWNGNATDCVYTINSPCSNSIECLYAVSREAYQIFTLEEFLEKYPFKVGDKVNSPCRGCVKTITSMEWDTNTNAVTYILDNRIYTNVDLLKVFNDLQPYKEETMEERKYADLRLDVDQDDKLATEATIDGDKITAPENYLIGKVTKVDNGVLVEFVKKQPQYPKTYEECCKVMGIDSDNFLSIRNLCLDDGEEVTTNYKQDFLGVLESLRQLKICRDAYWKIAGEQMGLGMPWDPMFSNPFLNFPTDEIRDAFYENFKDLIENCKELL